MLQLDPTLQTLAELLRDDGFATGAIVNNQLGEDLTDEK